MATRPVDLHLLCLLPIGVITQQRLGDLVPTKYVYQRTGKFFGNIPLRGNRDLQIRRHVIGLNPQTPAQTARRVIFADAVTAWGLLSQAEKDVYNRRARPRKYSGWNLFISDFLKAA